MNNGNIEVYSNRRNKTFDFLKLYAMLSVVLDHALQHMLGESTQSTQLYNWIFFISNANIYVCVWVFCITRDRKKRLL